MSVGTAPATSVLATRTVACVALDKLFVARLRRASKQQQHWLLERDALIREAQAAGGSLREIAAIVGLSHIGVKRIVDKDAPPASRREARVRALEELIEDETKAMDE